MEKKQITKRVADKLGLPEHHVADEIDRLIEKISKGLRRTEAVQVRGLGTIRQSVQEERTNA